MVYHREPPVGWWAESPDWPALAAAEKTLTKTRALVREAVAVHLPGRVGLDETFLFFDAA